MAKRRQLRPGDRLDDDIVVVRGGRLDSIDLRSDAMRNHTVYGDYGISVFALRDVTVDELAQQTPLVRFGELTLMRVGVLRAAGFHLQPSGRNPLHFTVAFDDLDVGVHELRRCEHLIWVNPYHEK